MNVYMNSIRFEALCKKMKFSLPAYPTVYFSNEIWVHCPTCAEPGLVTTESPGPAVSFTTGHGSVFNCNFCGFKAFGGSDNWSGYIQGHVNSLCGYCGSHISYTTEITKVSYKIAEITCEVCKKEREYEINWYRYRRDKPTDPYFGFDLWLQISVKNNTLWLYNIDHLEYLKAYVEARLREDDGRHKYSMITNLPQWIKSAKNRELIIRKLNKLKQEFEKKVGGKRAL